MTQARYLIGATAAEGGVETTTTAVDPFSLEDSRAHANEWASKNTSYAGIIVTLRPTADNRDVNTHLEVFDVDAEQPDPASNRWATPGEAQAAMNARMAVFKADMAPYTYVASYVGGIRTDENFAPAPQKATVTTKAIAAGGLFLGLLGLGFAASLRGQKRRRR